MGQPSKCFADPRNGYSQAVELRNPTPLVFSVLCLKATMQFVSWRRSATCLPSGGFVNPTCDPSTCVIRGSHIAARKVAENYSTESHVRYLKHTASSLGRRPGLRTHCNATVSHRNVTGSHCNAHWSHSGFAHPPQCYLVAGRVCRRTAMLI